MFYMEQILRIDTYYLHRYIGMLLGGNNEQYNSDLIFFVLHLCIGNTSRQLNLYAHFLFRTHCNFKQNIWEKKGKIHGSAQLLLLNRNIMMIGRRIASAAASGSSRDLEAWPICFIAGLLLASHSLHGKGNVLLQYYIHKYVM